MSIYLWTVTNFYIPQSFFGWVFLLPVLLTPAFIGLILYVTKNGLEQKAGMGMLVGYGLLLFLFLQNVPNCLVLPQCPGGDGLFIALFWHLPHTFIIFPYLFIIAGRRIFYKNIKPWYELQ